jgi:hypothetical protein
MLTGCFARVDTLDPSFEDPLPTPGVATTLPEDTGEDIGRPDSQACVDGINAYRATLDLPQYGRWVEAEDCVSGQAEADQGTGVAHSAFGNCGEWAQNECPGWPGPPGDSIQGCLDMMWAEGPGEDFDVHGHYLNMSSDEYTEVACGFYELPDGSWWGAQDFR